MKLKFFIAISLFVFAIPIAVFSQNDSPREIERKQYVSDIFSQYEDNEFFEIPWMAIFNNGSMDFFEVESFFNEKLGNIDLLTENKKLFKKWNMYRRMQLARTPNDGVHRFADEGMEELKAYKQANMSRNSATSANWQFIGQTTSIFETNNGRIERVNFHPTNTNIIWASAPEGGLWKSADGGSTWAIQSEFWDHLSVGDLIYNTNDPDTIFVATDDHDSWFNQNRGVLRSDDGGTTWAIVGLPNSQATNVYKLGMHPDGRTVFAGTSHGLFKSTDHGVTWVRNNALPNNINDFEFHPTNSQVMYVVIRMGPSPDQQYFYVSTDGGSTFSQPTMTLENDGKQVQVAVSPNMPDVAYIGIYPKEPTYSPTGARVMKYVHSTGAVTTLLDPTQTTPVSWVGGAWDFRLEVNPSDGNHVVYGCVYDLQSFDGGATWVNLNVLHADVHDIKWQSGTNKLWMADDGGLGHSTDNGATWTSIKGIPVMQWYSVASTDDGTRKLLGAQDAGIFFEVNGNWQFLVVGDGLEVKIDPVDENRMYSGVQEGLGNTYYRYDPGTSLINGISIFNQATAGGTNAAWWNKILINGADRNTLLTNYQDIWKSTDRGQTWTNLTNGTLGNGTGVIHHLIQSKSDPNILVAVYSGNFKKSTDGGTTWASITPPGIWVSSYPQMVMSPTDPNKIWVAGSGVVKKTTDGGTTWTDYTGTIPSSAGLFTITYQEGTDDGLYVAGLTGNIFYRDNTMTDWVLYNTNLPHVRLYGIEALPHQNKVRVATWGRGVWETPAHTNSVNPCSEPMPPAVTTNICGSTATLTTTAAPSGYSIAWYKNDAVISGQTGTSLNATTAGIYKARYLANTGSCHSYMSEPADVAFNAAVSVVGGNALNFDGTDDYMSINRGYVDFINSSFSISFWAKRDVVGAQQFIYDQGFSITRRRLHLGFRSDNKFIFAFFGDDLITSDAYSDTGWHHWACVFDNSIASPAHNRFIYRDGILVASDRAGGYLEMDGAVEIGRGFGSNYFNGSLDELKFWKTARSQAQVQGDIYCPMSCVPSDLLLYLPFQQGTANGDNTGLTAFTDYSLQTIPQNLHNFALTGNSSNISTGVTLDMEGGENVCPYFNWAYSVPQVFGATSYTWTLPSGWTGSSTTQSISVTPTATGGDVQCAVTTPCGTLNFTKTITARTKCESGIDLDGTDDYIDVKDGVYFNGDFTFEAWVKPETQVDWNRPMHFSPNGGNENAVFFISSIASTGRPGFYVYSGSSETVVAAPTALPINEWTHVAVTLSGTVGTMYLNGEVAATNNSMHVPPNLNREYCRLQNNIQLDELKIWSKVLTQTEIREKMFCTTPAPNADLELYFPFENGAPGGSNLGNTTAIDFSGKNNHGTLFNFALTGAASNYIAAPKPLNMTGGATVCPELSWKYSVPTISGATAHTWTLPSGWTGSSTTREISVTPSATGGEIKCVVAAPCGNLEFTKTISVKTTCGDGFDFDGADDYVDVKDGVYFNGNFTVEAWVYQKSVAAWSRLIDFGNGSANNNIYIALSAGTTGKPQLAVFNGAAWSGFEANVDLPLNKWVHFAATLEGTTGKIYMDGELVGSGTVNVPNNVTRTNCYIGKSNWGDPGANIKLDEFRIWNVARTAAELKANMFCTMSSPPSSVLVYLPFDDGVAAGNNASNNSTVDHSANGNHGDLIGFNLNGNNSNYATGVNITRYLDSDMDGYGDPANSSTQFCLTGNYVTVNGDCNDSNNSIHPNAADGCGNMVNENCNSTSDENTLLLDFDGTNDYVDLGNNFNFGTADFTIEMRVKTTDTHAGLISKRGACSCENFWNIIIVNGNAIFEMFENTSCGNGVGLTSTNTINDGNWHHIAVTRLGKGVRLYIDGVLDKSGYAPANVSNAVNLELGKSICTWTNFYYDGQMDEVRIWNYARSGEEINAFKNSSVLSNSTGLDAYYDFNNSNALSGQNNSGQNTLEDMAGSFDGTLHDFALNGAQSNYIGNPDPNCKFTTTANGGWGTAANWTGGAVPPNPMPKYIDVDINHATTLSDDKSLTGDLTISSGASLTVAATKTLTNNGTLMNSGDFTNNGIFANNGTLANQGMMMGSGTFNGDFTNPASGTLAPGTSPGCQTYGNDFTNNGKIEIELADGTACTNFDQIMVNGDATVNGNIEVSFIGGNTPTTTSFTILTADNISGTPSITWPSGFTGTQSIINSTTPHQMQLAFSALPVELVNFRAILLENNSVELLWRTESEVNNKGFEIERSRDGIFWESIGFINGHGTTVIPHEYLFTDKSPYHGINYFRLRQMDYDGQFEYSNIVSIYVADEKPIVHIYPNPVKNGELNIEFSENINADADLLFYAVTGQILFQKNITELKSTLDVGNLPVGIYLIEIRNGNEIWRERVVVR